MKCIMPKAASASPLDHDLHAEVGHVPARLGAQPPLGAKVDVTLPIRPWPPPPRAALFRQSRSRRSSPEPSYDGRSRFLYAMVRGVPRGFSVPRSARAVNETAV